MCLGGGKCCFIVVSICISLSYTKTEGQIKYFPSSQIVPFKICWDFTDYSNLLLFPLISVFCFCFHTWSKPCQCLWIEQPGICFWIDLLVYVHLAECHKQLYTYLGHKPPIPPHFLTNTILNLNPSFKSHGVLLM